MFELIFGAATGLITSVLNGIFTYKAKKLDAEIKKADREHEIAVIKAETDAMIMESKANIQITKAQIEGEIEVSDANAFIQGQKEANKDLFDNKWINKLFSVKGKWQILTFPIAVLISFLFGMVDFIRMLIRPTLTVYLCGLSTWITITAYKILEQSGTILTNAQAVAIWNDVTHVIIFLTVSCVTFWFSDRRMAKTIEKFLTKEKKEEVTI